LTKDNTPSITCIHHENGNESKDFLKRRRDFLTFEKKQEETEQEEEETEIKKSVKI
jgi:hypothetical protein